MTATFVLLTRNAPSDVRAILVSWAVPDGTYVEAGCAVAMFEGAKASFDVHAPRSGYLFRSAQVGDALEVGAAYAVLADEPDFQVAPRKGGAKNDNRRITAKAHSLMQKHGLSEADLPGEVTLVTAAIVENLRGAAPEPPRAEPDDNSNGDDLHQLLAALRGSMRARFQRHVPVGTLLNDRWGLARELGFGDGASIYDESLVLGDVRIGAHTWVGPFTVLDGAAAPLTVGDHCSIGAGAHLYTHDTIDWALTGGAAKPRVGATTIGRCCFISPQAMIGPGADIGPYSFVAAHSFVVGAYPAYSYIAGAPARRVGRVEIENGHSRLVLEDEEL